MCEKYYPEVAGYDGNKLINKTEKGDRNEKEVFSSWLKRGFFRELRKDSYSMNFRHLVKVHKLKESVHSLLQWEKETE